MARSTFVGVNQENVGVLGGGDLVGIHCERICLADLAGDPSPSVISDVSFVFRGIRAETDFGWV